MAIVGLLSVSFQLLLPVIPVVVEHNFRGAGGAATASVYVATVVGDLTTPWLMSRWSGKVLIIVGLTLMAGASLAYVGPSLAVSQMLAAAAARGLGTGMTAVVAVALIAESTRPGRIGRSMGLFGLSSSIPWIVCPSIGVTLFARSGMAPVAVLAAASAGFGAILATRLGEVSAQRIALRGALAALARNPSLLALIALFTVISSTLAGVVTYVPLMLPAVGLTSASTFFFVAGACRAVGRVASGPIADRISARAILWPGVLATGSGLILVAAARDSLLAVPGALLYGAGSGVVQTGAYVAMTKVRGAPASSLISSFWNASIDIGGSLGGVVVGLAAAISGYGAAAWIVAAMAFGTMPLALSQLTSLTNGKASSQRV